MRFFGAGFDMPLAVTSLIALMISIVALAFVNRYFLVSSYIKTIVNIVLVLIIVGILLWFINVFVPMAGSIKAIINIVVVVAACVGVLQAVGLWGNVVNTWDHLRHRTSPNPHSNV